MNTVIARAVVALSLVALPASALASSGSTHTAKHGHTVAKKDGTPKKKAKHHGHKASAAKGVAAPAKEAAEPSPAKAP